jgi:NADH-quinone oxidoreductase subunit L
MNTIFLLIVFLPLLGAILAGVFGTALLKGTQDHAAHAHHDDDHHHDHGPSWPMYLTTAFLMISALLSWFAFFDVAIHEQTYKVHVLDFIRSGGMAADWAFRVDTLTAVMLVVVTTVSALVHMYSLGYMSHDPQPQRFFSYLSLFTFAMLMLVTSDNLVQMFFGWEGVGLASYLLIGFWYKKPSANAAAIKAFVVNRVGDFGFALGIFATFMMFGSIEFDTIFAAAPEQVARP